MILVLWIKKDWMPQCFDAMFNNWVWVGIRGEGDEFLSTEGKIK